MEQMRFDLGNPQEEAPKRIQKRRIPRKLKILAAVIVLVLAVRTRMRQAALRCTAMAGTRAAALLRWMAVWWWRRPAA